MDNLEYVVSDARFNSLYEGKGLDKTRKKMKEVAKELGNNFVYLYRKETFLQLKKEFEEKNTPKKFVVIEQDFRRMVNGSGRTTIIFSSDDEKQCHEMCRVQNELYEKSKIHGVVLLTYRLDKPDDREVQ